MAPLCWRLAAVSVASLALVAARAEEAAGSSKPSEVVTLTSEDFDRRVGNGTEAPWLIKFYAPWCGHCRHLAPVWDELAVKLKGTVHVAKVDCTQERWLMDQWGIEGFPTLKLVAEGAAYSYSGRRGLAELEAFARGGWRTTEAELLPQDQPFRVRAMKATFAWLWTYGMPLSAVLFLVLVAWCFFYGDASEEELEKRRAFEARMAELEKRKRDAGEPAAQAVDASAEKASDDKKED